MNYPHHQTNYGYPSPDSPQPFPVDNTGWNPTLYMDTPPVEPMDSPVFYDAYAQITPNAHGVLSIPPGVHAVQPTSSIGTENWAPSSVLHPGFVPFSHSPSPPFTPSPSSSTLQNGIHSRPSMSTNAPDYIWLPQRQYALTAHHFIPATPILFDVDSGEPGIRLSAALNRKFAHLKDRDDLVYESSKSPTITMRLEWPGFASWGRQVRVLDSRSIQQSISREKLAYEVAKTVFRFAESQSGRQPSANGGAPSRDSMWVIGEGGIGLDDLLLVRVENVSKGSWQPQFLVRRRQ